LRRSSARLFRSAVMSPMALKSRSRCKRPWTGSGVSTCW
jgi:hypothetical protein